MWHNPYAGSRGVLAVTQAKCTPSSTTSSAFRALFDTPPPPKATFRSCRHVHQTSADRCCFHHQCKRYHTITWHQRWTICRPHCVGIRIPESERDSRQTSSNSKISSQNSAVHMASTETDRHNQGPFGREGGEALVGGGWECSEQDTPRLVPTKESVYLKPLRASQNGAGTHTKRLAKGHNVNLHRCLSPIL